MRWSHLTTTGDGGAEPLALSLPGAVARTFSSPGFAGMTFYEIRAKSIINRVPGSSRVPFEWTLNPYRGCTHACRYCFARNTHTYLDLDAGEDFDRRVIVKINAPELLRRELAAARWRGDPIAMGTNVDCYQRAEGKYQLMRGILAALRDFGNPFSILTKGTLILRDLDLLREAASVTTVRLAVSIGFVDKALWRSVEPGTPSPHRRLDVVRRLTDAGFAVSVLMAPILPGLTDDDASIEATTAAIAAAGAASLTPLPLHLRTGAREWYSQWLVREHPDLVPRYRQLFQRGAYSPGDYQRELTARVRIAARRHGIGTAGPADDREPTDRKPPDGGRSPGGHRHGTADGRHSRPGGGGRPATTAGAAGGRLRPPIADQPPLW